MDMENVDNTDRRIADFRRNLQNYEEMSHQNRSSDPDSGYRTATPEPGAFIADPESPHLAPSPRLHPNITTRARSRNHRRLSDLFGLSHRGRNTPTPTFDHDNRPKISRPIVDQGEIEVPNNGPYIYNHPSRPRLDVEIPRSSFSDLWGQRYGPIGDMGYDVDHVQRDVRNTQSVDLGQLVGGRENYRHDTRRYGVSLGGIADWSALVTANSTTGSTGVSEHGQAGQDDDMDASYLAPLVSPTLDSSSPSIVTASASLPSISNLPPLPLSTSNLPALPPSTVALDEERNPTPGPEVDLTRSPSPVAREQSERWIRHPLRQNPPTHHLPFEPPPPPPSSPVHFPTTPSPVPDPWSTVFQHFRPSCGVVISNIGSTAMVQPFIVTHDHDDHMGFESSSEEDSIVQVREDTPSPLPVQRRLFVDGDGTATPTAPAAATQPLRRRSGVWRSLCCGLFPRRRCRAKAANTTSTSTSTQPFAPLSQRSASATHITIPERNQDGNIQVTHSDEEPDNDQENQPPTIIESLVESNNEHGEQGQEVVEAEGVRRRPSVRHSWVTVSRWLE
ncbi:hypothetical protein E4T49_08195 [Aureobasidium sp. EXF-10728]|nr:hypothetical protein E4T49_08195 [Aureobasidium sp. EXF-10728]